MDYQTKPISRRELRLIAKTIRRLFGCRNKYYFDVIDAFEKVHKVVPKIFTEIIGDGDANIIPDLEVPAACMETKDGITIYVREKIYDGAVKDKGGFRAHIMHEMSHAFLFLLGFRPVLTRSFKNNEIQPMYISVEWQAKALTGEILVPHEVTKGMSARSIMKRCCVSKECACRRRKLDE